MKYIFVSLLISLATTVFAPAQAIETPNFRTVIEGRLKEKYRTELTKVCPIDIDPVASRIFREYGAMFLSNNGGISLPKCIFDNEAEVQSFQQSTKPDVATIGGVRVTLEKDAMMALLSAREEASKKGLLITPRGGTEASTRSFGRTVDLWRSRFIPGLNYWTAKGRIKREDAEKAQRASIQKQVEMVLAWEQNGLYFSKDRSKSILYSVAAPGASQHIFMLALDVEQFANKQVRQILAKHGWFQTVKSDLPHFTFLGVKESDLSSLGLISVTANGQMFWIPNMK